VGLKYGKRVALSVSTSDWEGTLFIGGAGAGRGGEGGEGEEE